MHIGIVRQATSLKKVFQMYYSYESESMERERLLNITCTAIVLMILAASITLWNSSQFDGGQHQLKISQAAVSYVPNR